MSIELTNAFAVPTNLDDSIDLLDRFIRMTSSLEDLDIGANHFQDLPASFIDTIISHPRLGMLELDDNHRLGCIRDRSTPCVINRLLSQLSTAASSPRLTLCDLSLEGFSFDTECCGPDLEKVLALGSRGLRSLYLEDNPSLTSHGWTLARINLYDNFTIEECCIDGLCSYDSDERLL